MKTPKAKTTHYFFLLFAPLYITCHAGNMAEHFNETAMAPESKPKQVIEALEIMRTDTIADIGAGGGYFSLEFAGLTDAEVYAVDISKEYLQYIENSCKTRGIDNVITVLASEKGPNLPKGKIDLVFMRNVFHHIPDRVNYFSRLRKYIKPAGRVAIVEYTKKGIGLFHFGHHSKRTEIVEDLQKAGYRVRKSFDFLEKQSFIIFGLK